MAAPATMAGAVYISWHDSFHIVHTSRLPRTRLYPPCTLCDTGASLPCTQASKNRARQGAFCAGKCARCGHFLPCTLFVPTPSPTCTLLGAPGRGHIHRVHFSSRSHPYRVNNRAKIVHGGSFSVPESVHAAGQTTPCTPYVTDRFPPCTQDGKQGKRRETNCDEKCARHRFILPCSKGKSMRL